MCLEKMNGMKKFGKTVVGKVHLAEPQLHNCKLNRDESQGTRAGDLRARVQTQVPLATFEHGLAQNSQKIILSQD